MMSPTTLWIVAFFFLLLISILTIISMGKYYRKKEEQLENECSSLTKEFTSALTAIDRRDNIINQLQAKLQNYENNA